MNYSFSNEQKPIAIIEVAVNESSSEVIKIFKNDNIQKVAEDFCEKFDIISTFIPTLIKMIKAQVIQHHQEQHRKKTNMIPEIPVLEDLPATEQNSTVNEARSLASKEMYENWQERIKKKQEETPKRHQISTHRKPSIIPVNVTQPCFKKFKKKNKPSKPITMRKPERSPSQVVKTQREFIHRQGIQQQQTQYKLSEMRREQSLPVDKTTKKPLFKPEITKGKIYDKVKKKEEQEDKSLVEMLKNSRVSVNQKGENKSCSPPSDQSRNRSDSTPQRGTSGKKVQDSFIKRQQDKSAQKIKRLSELRSQQTLQVDKQTNQPLFQPQITKDHYYQAAVWKDERENKELIQKLRSYPQIETPKIESIKSFVPQPRFDENKLISLFNLLDHDNDGLISSSKIRLDGLKNDDYALILNVVGELEEKNQEFTVADFLRVSKEQITGDKCTLSEDSSLESNITKVPEPQIPKRYQQLMDKQRLLNI